MNKVYTVVCPGAGRFEEKHVCIKWLNPLWWIFGDPCGHPNLQPGEFLFQICPDCEALIWTYPAR